MKTFLTQCIVMGVVVQLLSFRKLKPNDCQEVFLDFLLKKKKKEMKMKHKDCGGAVAESYSIAPYISEEFGTVPAYQCLLCLEEIVGDAQIELVPETEAELIQIEGLEINAMGCCQEEFLPPVCTNCHEEIENLNFVVRIWNAYFFCNECGRMMRFTAIATAVLMTILGWFY